MPSRLATTAVPGSGARDSDRMTRHWVGNLLEPTLAHLEHAELVRRAEAVLRGAQRAVVLVALAFEIEHGIDHVLEHARPRDRAVLRDVADDEHGRSPPLFATCISARPHSRTCVTEPGPPSRSPRDSVWIESMISASGAVARGPRRSRRGRSRTGSEPSRHGAELARRAAAPGAPAHLPPPDG